MQIPRIGNWEDNKRKLFITEVTPSVSIDYVEQGAPPLCCLDGNLDPAR